jgi:gas vesicle protein
MKSDLHRRLIDLIRSIEKSSDQRSKSLYSENQKMAVLLKNNSEAFDRLQEEVRGEYSKIKLKSQEKLAETLKDVRGKHEKEIEELKNENKKIRDLLDKANSTIMIDTHLNKQLKEEVENLRSEKEVIRKKQLILEEKIQTQTNNFRAQLKNKQQELETLKKSSNFSNS